MTDGGGWSIRTNVPITRRKSYHIVVDPAGVTRWRDRHFWACVEWLDREEVQEYTIAPAERFPSPPRPLRVNRKE